MAIAIERSTAIGVFRDRASAQTTVNQLRQAGFLETDIGVASRDGEEIHGASAGNDNGSKAAAGAAAGVATGAGAGLLWGLGVIAGVLPAIGPVIAGGTLAAILASSAAGAAAGGMTGVLVGLGIPEDEAQHYESEFRAGHILVTVKAPSSRYNEAVAIMERAGARVSQYA